MHRFWIIHAFTSRIPFLFLFLLLLSDRFQILVCMKIISVQELAQYLKAPLQLQLIDVRESYEVQISSIGGLHIPMALICERIAELSATLPTCVLCKTGRRAEAVANLLETDFGFLDVMVVKGGITAYAREVDNSLEVYE